MNNEHRRRLRFHFGINNERLNRAVAMLQIDPLVMARGLFQLRPRPILGESRSNAECCDKQPKNKSAKFHAFTERCFRMIGNQL